MAMSKLLGYNWRGYDNSKVDNNKEDTFVSTFEQLLELNRDSLNIHTSQQYTHKNFKHSDELEAIRNFQIDFTNDIDNNECIIDKTGKLSSISKMQENVPDIWHQSLIMSWFAYSNEKWISNNNVNNPLFIAINILRQLQINETDKGYFATINNNYDNELYKSFPIPDDSILPKLEPSNFPLPFNICNEVIEVWLTKQIEIIAIELKWDNTFWNRIYDEILFMISYSLHVMSPILYQIYGYDIIVGSMNHGLVFRSILFGLHSRIKIKASKTISHIWGNNKSDQHYYTLNSSYDLKNRLLSQLPPNIYYVDDKQYTLEYLLNNIKEQKNLAIQFEHQRCYDAINDLEFKADNFVHKVNSLSYSLNCKKELLSIIDKQLEDISYIFQYLQKKENGNWVCLTDIVEPLQLLQSTHFAKFENSVNNVFGPCCGFDSLNIDIHTTFSNFEIIKLRLSHILELSSNKEIQLHDQKINIFNSSKDNIKPIISPLYQPSNSKIPMTIIQFAYNLLDLFNGKAKINLIRGNIIIGETYKHLPNTPDIPDAKGNKIAHEFLDKLKKVSEFFTFVQLCRIYNQDYFKYIIECYKDISFITMNDPIYDSKPVESKLFFNILQTVNPLKNTKIKLTDLVSTLKVSLDIASTDKTYGLMGLKWFSTIISKFISSFEELE